MIDKTNYENLIKEISHKSGICSTVATILVDRGIDTFEKIIKFLYPELENLTPYSLIPNIELGAERIRKAIKRKEKILIYGDYDVDGICAVAILYLYFKDMGINASYFIPSRFDDGYGLNMERLEILLSENKPNLLITVDCGISNYNEVEFLKSNNIDVIITDHHNLPEKLPNTICINGKMSDNESLSNLCGGGVALRLVEALAGIDYAKQFFDIAALATIADIVPLTEDNRIITHYGLKLLNNNKRLGLKMLIEKSCKRKIINSTNIAYTIAPRINAAGRMTNASYTLNIFTSDDFFILDFLTNKLNEFNAQRQKKCDAIYNECIIKLLEYDLTSIHSIVLYDENWDIGVLGIVAAKLCSEFKMPAILLKKEENILKGSSRSTSNVDIYKELNKLKHLFISFGGHSQAAGLSLELNNYNEFCVEFNNNILEKGHFYIEESEKTYNFSQELFSINNVKQLEMLEPFGCSNPKPVFILNERYNFKRLNVTDHIKASLKNGNILAFNKLKYLDLLNSNSNVKITAEIGLNEFNNKFSCDAFVKDITIQNIGENLEKTMQVLYYKQLLYKDKNLKNESYKIQSLSKNDIKNILANTYKGNLFVAYSLFSAKSFLSYIEKENIRKNLINISYLRTDELNPVNTLIYGLEKDFDAKFYKNIIFLERPLSFSFIESFNFSANIYYLNENAVFSETYYVNEKMLKDFYLELELNIERINKLSIATKPNEISKLLCLDKKYSYVIFNLLYYIIFEQKMLIILKEDKMKLDAYKFNVENSKFKDFFK